MLTDDSPSEGDIPTKVDVAGHRQVVELDDRWNLLESFLELLDLRRRNDCTM